MVSVILCHAGLSIAPGGFVGVDLFFVLSGYLITGLLWKDLKQTSHLGLLNFYARRLKRLLPTLLTVLLVSTAAAAWLLSKKEFLAQLSSAPYATTWTSNIFFTFQTIDYFDELSDKDIFLHTWSLGVEEQFYLIWPLLLLILYRFESVRRNNKDGFPRNAMIGLSVVLITSFALCLYWSKADPDMAFYLMPSRTWQFSLGGLVFLLYQGKFLSSLNSSIVKMLQPILLSLGLVLIFASFIFINSNMPYPGWLSLLPSFGAAFVIASGSLQAIRPNPLLSNPILVWVGDRSYSLYLWHWPILILGFSLGYREQWLPTLFMFAMTVILSMLSYRFIEIPFWKGKWSGFKPKKVVLICLLLMTTVSAVYFYIIPLPKQVNTKNPKEFSVAWRPGMPVIYKDGCDAWYFNSDVKPCIYGAEKANKTVAFVGDSIGAQWFSILPATFNESNWRIVAYTKSACPMVDEPIFYDRIGKIYNVCSEWRNKVIKELVTMKPDIIVIGSASTYAFTNDQWIEGTARILKQLTDHSSDIFIIAGTPNLGFHGPGCVSRNMSPDGKIDLNKCTAQNRVDKILPVTQNLKNAASHFANVHLLNFNDIVCPNQVCSAISMDGQYVYRDNQHLTDEFVKARIPEIRKRIENQF